MRGLNAVLAAPGDAWVGPLTRAERGVVLALLALPLLAWLLPALPLPAHYHAFADQRALWGLPHAMDVLSNLAYAGMAACGAWLLRRHGAGTAGVPRGLLRLLCAGLLTTAACSAFYHLAPGDARLVLDRLGMAPAFAAVLGLAVDARVSRRAGLVVAAATATLAVITAGVAGACGNMAPWAALQGGALLALLVLAARPARPGALHFSLFAVVALYGLAKALELLDAPVLAWSAGWISGHNAKHLVSALAVAPIGLALWRCLPQSSACQGTPVVAPDMSPPPATPQPAPSQFALLRQRRFAPFFWTQFFGAANDNLFKFAFTVLVTYQLSVSWLPPEQAGMVIGAVFILPFLLFSATSGQLSDKFEKTRVIRLVKDLEIAIMVLAAWGFFSASVAVLLACVFLMGLHSTLFGPVKYAYLPQVLGERELTGGNGLVEMGTFVAILLGNVAGGLLVALPQIGHATVALACLLLAAVGRGAAHYIPHVAATTPGLRINWNPFSETWRNLRLARQQVAVFRSVLGISWMWFFGAIFLANFPAFAKDVLHGNEHVAALLLVVFSVGIGVGSLLCEKLSQRHVEIGLVPVGAVGMTVFAVDLYFASRGLPPVAEMGAGAFLAQPAHWRLMADLLLLSLFAGLYSVPMYALIQLRTAPTHRARIIAANNILNALFMIASSLIAVALLELGLSIPQVFLAVGLANALVSFYIFLLVPEYLIRFIAWVVTRLVYRYRIAGDAHIPEQGAAVLVANHVSFVDAILLMAASPRPMRFIMDHQIFRIPVLGWLFRLAGCIPIASRKADPHAYEQAFADAARVLREGELLAIFPEGAITHDGRLQPFRGGIMKILEQARADGLDVPVIPMALTNMWGSFFSRVEKQGAMTRPFRRGFFSRVGVNIGQPVMPAEATPERLQERVAELLAEPG